MFSLSSVFPGVWTRFWGSRLACSLLSCMKALLEHQGRTSDGCGRISSGIGPIGGLTGRLRLRTTTTRSWRSWQRCYGPPRRRRPEGPSIHSVRAVSGHHSLHAVAEPCIPLKTQLQASARSLLNCFYSTVQYTSVVCTTWGFLFEASRHVCVPPVNKRGMY
jgi:hypothetical protein